MQAETRPDNNFTSRYLRCCDRELHVVTWGDPARPPLILWHGLARTSRDFDDLAQALCDTYFIIAPDTIGRGLSQWSPRPEREYCLAFYADLAAALVDHFGCETVRWVGTSMGGAIGMRAAAGPLRDRISHLVLNDIGAEPVPAAIARIRAYAGTPPHFDTMTEFEAFLRTVYKPYGWQSDAQWRRMAETSMRRLPDGRITPHYDPAMVGQFTHHPDDYVLWEAYDRLTMPVLLLRGESSDLLSPQTAEAMTQRGPKATLVTVPGCGHAPCLNVPEQIGWVREFLAH